MAEQYCYEVEGKQFLIEDQAFGAQVAPAERGCLSNGLNVEHVEKCDGIAEGRVGEDGFKVARGQLNALRVSFAWRSGFGCRRFPWYRHRFPAGSTSCVFRARRAEDNAFEFSAVHSLSAR